MHKRYGREAVRKGDVGFSKSKDAAAPGLAGKMAERSDGVSFRQGERCGDTP